MKIEAEAKIIVQLPGVKPGEVDSAAIMLEVEQCFNMFGSVLLPVSDKRVGIRVHISEPIKAFDKNGRVC